MFLSLPYIILQFANTATTSTTVCTVGFWARNTDTHMRSTICILMYCSSVCIGKNVAQLVKYWSGVQRVEIKERSECTATSKKASFKCIHVKNVGHPTKNKECTQDHSSQHNVPSESQALQSTQEMMPLQTLLMLALNHYRY